MMERQARVGVGIARVVFGVKYTLVLPASPGMNGGV